MAKLIRRTLLFVVIPVLLFYAYLLWINNRTQPMPAATQLDQAREQAIGWLLDNHNRIVDETNDMLWRMIQQAGEVSGDPRLLSLFADYENAHLKHNHRSIWRPLFYPGSWSGVRPEDIAGLPYYNQHFIYAISCDSDLGNIESIAAQNHPDFCDTYPLKPACVTHQLMGIRLMQRIECGSAPELAATVSALQDRIVRQLTFDPRVVDIYLQRVLMLTESGASDRVKPVWLARVLEAQLADGGWSGFQPLIPLGEDKQTLGFAQKGIGIGTAHSNFHATAQGVLLLTLLTHNASP